MNARGETPAYRNNIHASHGCSTCTLQLLPSSVTELRLTARTNPAQHPQAGRQAGRQGTYCRTAHHCHPRSPTSRRSACFSQCSARCCRQTCQGRLGGKRSKTTCEPCSCPPCGNSQCSELPPCSIQRTKQLSLRTEDYKEISRKTRRAPIPRKACFLIYRKTEEVQNRESPRSFILQNTSSSHPPPPGFNSRSLES